MRGASPFSLVTGRVVVDSSGLYYLSAPMPRCSLRERLREYTCEERLPRVVAM
ncbi:MAG: hypothetical protein ACO2OR_04450 [Desulfurococcaceae archaeon]